jgi:hypothetical protein
VNEKLQVLKLETWFDPLEMFRQITPYGIVNKEVVPKKTSTNDGGEGQEDLSEQTEEERQALGAISVTTTIETQSSTSNYNSTVNGDETSRMDPSKTSDPNVGAIGAPDPIDIHLAKSSDEVHPHPKTEEAAVHPGPGEAVAAPANSEETKITHEEMSRSGNPAECPFLMNRE